MKILIIRLSSMGDVIIQSAFTRQLKNRFPSAEIDFLTSKEFTSLVENNSDITNVLSYQRQSGWSDLKELWRVSQQINEALYDIVFDLHHNSRTTLIDVMTNAPMLRVDKRSNRRKILVKLKINWLKNLNSQHRRTIEDFTFLGIGSETLEGDGLTKISSNQIEKQKKIVLSPVASFAAKRWPIEYYQQLIELLVDDIDLKEYSFEIIAGPSDDYCQQLGIDHPRVKNLQGKTSLQESIDRIGNSSLCVTNDTGSLHIAESFGVPVVAMFGPTSPDFGFRPHLKRSEFMYAGISCSPCSTTGSKNCTKARHDCMLEIKPTAVYSKVKEILNSDSTI